MARYKIAVMFHTSANERKLTSTRELLAVNLTSAITFNSKQFQALIPSLFHTKEE